MDRSSAGRVSDFTLENFLQNMWVSISVSVLVIAVFIFYRRVRGDQNILKYKLKDKSIGIR